MRPAHDIGERIVILEKAVENLGDALKKRDFAIDEELADIQAELKAIKLFLSRSVPAFKEQFPEVLSKVR
jgi:hypothetical protein